MGEQLSDARPASVWCWGEYLLDLARRRLECRGEPVEIEDRVFDLLALLLEHREGALERQAIVTAIWGKRPVSDATLRQLIYAARRAVGDNGDDQHTISTLYGRGLKWVATVELVLDPASVPAGADELPPVIAPVVETVPIAANDGAAVVERRALPDRRGVDVEADARANDAAVVAASLVVPARAQPRRWPGPWWAVALIVLVAAGGVYGWMRWQESRASASNLVAGAHTAAQGSAAGVPAGSPSAASAGTVDVASATPRLPKAATATIAVLPFVDLNATPDQRYISDGLTAELINRLARIPHLRVTARTSSFMFRDKQVDVREAARQLGVAQVIEGSVQREGKKLRVRTALVDAAGGYELWAGEYTVNAGDVLQLEDEIARNVAKVLYPKLDPVMFAVASGNHKIDATAYNYYLIGLQYANRRTTADLARAIAYYRRAIAIEPAYVDAWAGIAVSYAVMRDYDSDMAPDTHYADALVAAKKVVQLDPDSSKGHMVLGLLYEDHWQWRDARREYDRALALDPSNATAHKWYAMDDWFIGDMQGALRHMRVAYALDPLSMSVNLGLSRALLYTGDVNGGFAQAQAGLALAPRSSLAHLYYADALIAKGQHRDALDEIRAAIALQPVPSANNLAFLGITLWAAGDHVGARKQLQIIEVRARRHYVSRASLAWLQWSVGDKDGAFASLLRASADHDHLLFMVSGQTADPWCSDPRFKVFLASMNLPLQR